jgi:hypothetical protein
VVPEYIREHEKLESGTGRDVTALAPGPVFVLVLTDVMVNDVNGRAFSCLNMVALAAHTTETPSTNSARATNIPLNKFFLDIVRPPKIVFDVASSSYIPYGSLDVKHNRTCYKNSFCLDLFTK